MWNFTSSWTPSNNSVSTEGTKGVSECSDDEVLSNTASNEEGLECPICWESFNLVENVPYVLWCGHTLCKNCIHGLQLAVVKFPTLPIQLPLFISCPWCNLLSFRLIYKGSLKFPRKNFFLLWMVENMNGDRGKKPTTSSTTNFCSTDQQHQPTWPAINNSLLGSSLTHRARTRRSQHTHQRNNGVRLNQDLNPLSNMERLNSSLRKSLAFFMHLTAKFPLVLIMLLIILYAVPASLAILALYILITVLFALPSFLILYFAYPSLDWLVREITN